MTSERADIKAFLERLGKLERRERWLRRGMVAGLVLTGMFVLMGQARPRRVVEAQKFIVRDSKGRERAFLGLSDDAQSVRLTLSDGDDRGIAAWMAVSVVGANLVVSYGDNGYIELISDRYSQTVRITDFYPSGMRKGLGWIPAYAMEGPSLMIKDKAGFQSVMGTCPLAVPKTGEERRTSAAHIELSDKDGQRIWSAP